MKDIKGNKNPNYRSWEVTKENLGNLYLIQGLSRKMVSQHFGLSLSTISKNLVLFGIKKGRNRNRLLDSICEICGENFKYYPQKSSGRFCSKQCSGKWHSGSNNNNYSGGKSKSNCGFCGKELEKYNSPSLNYKIRFCNPQCHGEYQKINNKLSNNPNWNGGKSFELYPLEFDEGLKEMIRERDDRICQICGKLEIEDRNDGYGRLCIHHIDYDKNNNDPRNLISLCHDCHVKTNFNRDIWKDNLYIPVHSIDARG